MAAVLVHIDLDGERPDASSLAALAVGREVASSWGATLYAAIVVHDPAEQASEDSTGRITSTTRVAGVVAAQRALSSAGADKLVVAISDAPVLPLWAVVGGAWRGVVDHLRPRLVLFGADAPSASELGPRTGALIGARLLHRARANADDLVELRDREGGHVRASDGGAAVALIGAARPVAGGGDDIDLVVLAMPGGADPRLELGGSEPAPVRHASGVVVAISDELAADPEIAAGAQRLARALGGALVGGVAAARAGAIAADGVLERSAPLAPELCIAIGAPAIDLAGAASLVRIGSAGGSHVDGALAVDPGASLDALARALERPRPVGGA